MGVLEAMMPMVTKAYSLFTVVGGSKLNANVMEDGQQVYDFGDGDPRVAAAEGTENYAADQQAIASGDASKQTEPKTDYCGYIALLGEAANLAMTTARNQQTEQNYQSSKPEARQAAAFYALAENEKTNKLESDYGFISLNK